MEKFRYIRRNSNGFYPKDNSLTFGSLSSVFLFGGLGSYSIRPVLFTLYTQSIPNPDVNFQILLQSILLFIYLLQPLSPGFITSYLDHWSFLTLLTVFTLAPPQNILHPAHVTYFPLSHNLKYYIVFPPFLDKDQYPSCVLQGLPWSALH